MNGLQWLLGSDAVVRGVAAVLLAMSVASWVVTVWKAWMLRRAAYDVDRSIAGFWQASSLEDAVPKLKAFDRFALVSPMVVAIQTAENAAVMAPSVPLRTLATAGARSSQITRVLRDALHQSLRRLQFGQVLLATVASTSPFVGLLGTVWGIHHALAAITGGGQITLDRLAGPVGEALVMTAAGLAVAIPAVLAYNVFGRSIARTEEALEGFAHDIRELLCGSDDGAANNVPAAVAAGSTHFSGARAT